MISPLNPTPHLPERTEVGTTTSQPKFTDIGTATSRTGSPKLEQVLVSLTSTDVGSVTRQESSTTDVCVGTSQRTTPRSTTSPVLPAGILAVSMTPEPSNTTADLIQAQLPQSQYTAAVVAATQSDSTPATIVPHTDSAVEKPVATRPTAIRKNSSSITRPSRPHRSVSFSNNLRSSSEERKSRRESEVTIRHFQHTATVSHSMQVSTTSMTIPDHILKQVRSSMNGSRHFVSDGQESSDVVSATCLAVVEILRPRF
jgi:hypothetical protein